VQLAILAVVWFLGTWVPFALLSLIDQRTSYLYYMVIVMPGIYIAVTYLLSRLWRLRRLYTRIPVALYGLSVIVFAVLLYPFVPVF